jgi:hypothetical protein
MNRRLSDSFIEIFLPALESLHLRELYISGLNITPRSCPHIVTYLSSPARCHLRSFNCNGNVFGLRCDRSIIDAIRQHNHSIPIVELHANQLPAGASDDDDETHSVSHWQRNFDAWKVSEALLSRILARNRLLKHETERQALRLLRYSRPFLLHTLPAPVVPSSTPHVPRTSRFLSLPVEIQQYILSIFGPTLSTAQRIRIFNYASKLSTLPPLLPRLSSGATQRVDSTGVWRGEQASASWLRVVGCDGYELEENEDPDGERVRWTIEMANTPWKA